eukprot:363205-Chlamydomonas_euryale.AAC.13
MACFMHACKLLDSLRLDSHIPGNPHIQVGSIICDPGSVYLTGNRVHAAAWCTLLHMHARMLTSRQRCVHVALRLAERHAQTLAHVLHAVSRRNNDRTRGSMRPSTAAQAQGRGEKAGSCPAAVRAGAQRATWSGRHSHACCRLRFA